jgi:hypothetical protein
MAGRVCSRQAELEELLVLEMQSGALKTLQSGTFSKVRMCDMARDMQISLCMQRLFPAQQQKIRVASQTANRCNA